MSNDVNDGQRPKRTTIQGRRFGNVASFGDADRRREEEELLPRLSAARLHATPPFGQRATQARAAER